MHLFINNSKVLNVINRWYFLKSICMSSHLLTHFEYKSLSVLQHSNIWPTSPAHLSYDWSNILTAVYLFWQQKVVGSGCYQTINKNQSKLQPSCHTGVIQLLMIKRIKHAAFCFVATNNCAALIFACKSTGKDHWEVNRCLDCAKTWLNLVNLYVILSFPVTYFFWSFFRRNTQRKY